MRLGLQNGLAGLAALFLAAGTIDTQAAGDMDLEYGTYARVKDWCKANRADPKGPDYKEKRAYINLSENEINWNQTVGRITNVAVDRNKINLTVEMTAEGAAKTVDLPLTRKNRKVFVLTGVNFYYCGTLMPNPWLGR